MSSRIGSQIITFYSYKGGTGRSMALANTAWILANNGKRVLMVDWDLEAPGLHRYFHPFLQDKDLASSPGVIDMMMSFEAAAIEPRPPAPDAGKTNADNPNWYLPFAEIGKYTLPLAWSFPQGGALDLLPAGRQDVSYAARFNSFDWGRFYDKFGGGVFLEAVKLNMRKQYDYILVDSRTGMSDVAGVCTVQLPDTLVLCFTFNTQSISGSAAVAGTVRKQRLKPGPPEEHPFRIFPVPMRVDYVEKERLEAARESARKNLSTFLDHLKKTTPEQYWGSVEVPYVPFYAFQEVLATVADSPGLTNSLLASLERVCGYLTDGDVTAGGPLKEEERLRLRGLYISRPSSSKVPSVISLRPELQSLADKLTTRSRSWRETNRRKDYLLTPSLTEELTGSPELVVALLQQTDFQEYWAASLQKIQMHNMVQASIIDAVLILIFGVSLLIEQFGDRHLATAFPRLSQLWAPVSAGLLGTAVSLLVRDLRGVGLTNERARFSTTFLELLSGFAVSMILALVLVNDTFGIKVTTSGTLIGIAALAGFYARYFMPELLQTLTAVDSAKDNTERLFRR